MKNFTPRFQLPLSGLLAGKLLNHAGRFLLGVGALWWVVMHAGPRTGTAIVHVTEPRVVVSVGGTTFVVGQEAPTALVCDLPAGEHRLIVKRGETVLYAETFRIRGGEERILAACAPSPSDPARDRNAPAPPSERPHP